MRVRAVRMRIVLSIAFHPIRRKRAVLACAPFVIFYSNLILYFTVFIVLFYLVIPQYSFAFRTFAPCGLSVRRFLRSVLHGILFAYAFQLRAGPS